MWLLNIDSRELEYFEGNKIPPYAILSHRWEHEELTFQEIKMGMGKKKHGYCKVDMCCRQAREDYTREQLSHVWVDTCCIDKTSSAELSEAINSMFRWYENASMCYAYLSDVMGDAESQSFQESLWFTRGWTLQELLAPTFVTFFDREWSILGTKHQLADVVSQITQLPSVAIHHFVPSHWSVAHRMQFAARRQTTRAEDQAYCLLGIFGVNMPLIYGEDTRAFRRLQEEILKSSDDLSILAWQSSDERSRIFAHSPSDFDHGLRLYKIPAFHTSTGASFSARGLSIGLELVPVRHHMYLAPLAAVDHKGVERYCMLLTQSANGRWIRLHDNSTCLFKTRPFKPSQYQQRTIMLAHEPVDARSNWDWGVRPSFTIAVSPECGVVKHFCRAEEGGTHDLNVEACSVGTFHMVYMRSLAAGPQLLLFGCDIEFRPLCLAIRSDHATFQTHTLESTLFIPQLPAEQVNVGNNTDMMMLVEAMQSRGQQRWDFRGGSVELHVVPFGQAQAAFYLASNHHIRFNIAFHGNQCDVTVNAGFRTSMMPKPRLLSRWHWRQLKGDEEVG